MISKKTLRVLAILACLGFITFTFSGVALAAEKKVQRPDIRTLLQKPIVLLNSLFNLFLNADLKAKRKKLSEIYRKYRKGITIRGKMPYVEYTREKLTGKLAEIVKRV